MYQVFRNPREEALRGLVDVLFEQKCELLLENSSIIKHLEHLEDLTQTNRERFIATIRGLLQLARQHEGSGEMMVVEKIDGCLHPDTIIKTADGDKSIYQIITEFRDGKNNQVFTYNEKTKKVELQTAQYPRINNNNKNWVRINLESGDHILATEDHKFLTTNRGWVEAKNLTPEDDLVELEKNDK